MDRPYWSKGKVKERFEDDLQEQQYSSFDHLSWPARNYVCSFCKREFGSAQALGGHMNVHRRDRARLRLLPSWDFDQNPNPPDPPNYYNSYYPITNYPSNSQLSSSSSSSSHSTRVPNHVLPFMDNKHDDSYMSSNLSLANKYPPSPSSPSTTRYAVDHLHVNGDQFNGLTKKDDHDHNPELELDKHQLLKQKSDRTSLDLDMKLFKDPKEDVDLELRLGFV